MHLSIIIPTLNEANYLPESIGVLRRQASDTFTYEIIVVDAGSRDQTVSLVESKVDRVVVDSKLRGMKYKSLNKGAELAQGEIYLFLDADCHLPPNFDALIIDTLDKPDVVGGAFEFKTNGGGLILKIVELINRLRYRIDKRYYGDQGIFCTRTAFDSAGGFPSKPIMEASYFCKKLDEIGGLKLIHASVLSSTRRFDQGGLLRVLFRDFQIWIQYILGMNVEKYGAAYWYENEQRGNEEKSKI